VIEGSKVREDRRKRRVTTCCCRQEEEAEEFVVAAAVAAAAVAGSVFLADARTEAVDLLLMTRDRDRGAIATLTLPHLFATAVQKQFQARMTKV